MKRFCGIITYLNKAYGNRTSYSKFVSRWNAPYDEDEQENIRENDGNKEKRSTTVGEERFGPDEAGGNTHRQVAVKL